MKIRMVSWLSLRTLTWKIFFLLLWETVREISDWFLDLHSHETVRHINFWSKWKLPHFNSVGLGLATWSLGGGVGVGERAVIGFLAPHCPPLHSLCTISNYLGIRGSAQRTGKGSKNVLLYKWSCWMLTFWFPVTAHVYSRLLFSWALGVLWGPTSHCWDHLTCSL